MAETAGSLTTVVSLRVRDPNNTAHSATDVRTLLTHAQRIINAHTQALLTEEAVAFTAGTVVSTAISTTAVDKILTIRCDNTDLARVPWTALQHYDPYWLRALGTPYAWAPIGRNLYALVPGVDIDRTLTLVGPKITAALTSAASATEIRDAHMPAILNLTEQLLLLRQRLYTSAKVAADRRPATSKIGNL